MPAERFGPAGQDVSDGTAVRWQQRCAMRRQVIVRKAAKDVAKLDHDRPLRSEAGHQLVEDHLERGSRRLGQVRVNGRRRDVDVAE